MTVIAGLRSLIRDRGNLAWLPVLAFARHGNGRLADPPRSSRARAILSGRGRRSRSSRSPAAARTATSGRGRRRRSSCASRRSPRGSSGSIGTPRTIPPGRRPRSGWDRTFRLPPGARLPRHEVDRRRAALRGRPRAGGGLAPGRRSIERSTPAHRSGRRSTGSASWRSIGGFAVTRSRRPCAFDDAHERASRIEAAFASVRRRSSCHNDLLDANFLWGTDVWVVDYEYAGMGNPFFDLANLSINNGLSEQGQVLLLQLYFGRAERWTEPSWV